MWLRIWTIAMNAYREAVRARVLLGLAGVAFTVSVFSLVIGSFTLDNAPRVVADLGAATISIFSIAVSIVIGATSLYRELEQKTIFPILARPITRGEYVIGKFGGTLLTVFVFIAADTGLVLSLLSLLAGRDALLVTGLAAAVLTAFGVLAWRVPWARTFGPIPFAIALLVLGTMMADVAPYERRLVLTSSFLSLLEVSIITACATMLSSFSSPFLSALLTVGVWIIGRNTDSFDRFSKKVFGTFISSAAKALGKVWPNLQVYVPRRPFLTGEALDIDRTQYLLMSSGLSLAWTLGFLSLAVIVFRRRDFL
jgi:ABC-type transport system involved in multi-copper enzyme maturation permease subunit